MKKTGFLTLIMGIYFLFTSACKDKGPIPVLPGSGTSAQDTSEQSAPRNNGKEYRMRMVSTPDIIEAGKKVVFSFTPQLIGKEAEPVPLETDRGYDMNLVMVNSDLSWFDYRHPGLSDLGTYEQSYIFDKGGVYHLYAEYTPIGSIDTVQVKSFPVNGNAVKGVIWAEPVMNAKAEPYDVTLSPGEGIRFESGKMQTIRASVAKDGMPVDANTLGDYLGGKGNLVIISVHEKSFQHVHPAVDNGDLVFHTSFAKPGMYRAWLQFQTENIIHTADFVLLVDEGSEKQAGADEDKMHMDQH